MLLSFNTVDTDKPLFTRRQIVSTIVLFLVLMGFGLWIYQISIMRHWQHDLLYNLEQVKKPQKVSAPKPQAPLMISKIALPALPKLVGIQAASISAAESSKTPGQTRTPTQTQPIQVEPKIEQAHGQASESKLDSQAVLQQLQSSSDLDLQIALPSNATQRERLLDYLYRCGGAQFAVLQQQQLVFLSPKRYVAPSQWLRIASGGLSVQESAWLADHQGRPVRLFPQTMDQRLASYIAAALQGETLRSLRAQYSLTDSGLALTHIKLNQQLITNQWPLHQSQCR